MPLFIITQSYVRQVDIQAEQPKAMMMHWAINDWNLSPEASRPEGTQQIDDKAVQTPFKDGKSIHLTFPEADCPSRSAFKSLSLDLGAKKRKSTLMGALTGAL